VLLRTNPPADEVVSHGVRQSQIVIPISGDIAILDDRVVDVATERLLHVGHVLDQRYSTDTDLFAPVLIRLRLGGHGETAVVDKHDKNQTSAVVVRQ